MTNAYATDEQGQALVVVGLAMVVLMGGLVLAVDWGHGLAMRRAAQNQADAAALAAGRFLATRYGGPGPSFGTTEEEVWNAACDARSANTPDSPGGVDRALSVTFLDSDVSPLGPSFTSTSETCTLSASTPVPDGTTFIQVDSRTTYPSLFMVISRQSIEAAASARARLTAGASVRQLTLPDDSGFFPVGDPGEGLSGSSTAPNAAIWPIVRRYNPSEWTGLGGTLRLMGPSAPGDSYFVSLAHFSPHEAYLGRTRVHQLITESDYTGAAAHHGNLSTLPIVSSVPGCPGGPMWSTTGHPDLAATATCDIPNWFYYGYRGSLAVGTDWGAFSWSTFESYGDALERPAALPPSARSRCSVWTDYPYLRAPSCDPGDVAARTRGDWVETATGVDEGLVANQILAFIARYGRDVGGEKAVVVNLFLWDCGESFDYAPSPDTRDNWDLISSSGDCSTATSGSFDRVHLLTGVPVTVRESDVNTSNGRVDARWGGVFGDAGLCATTPTAMSCALNPLINSAFLVPAD